LFFQELDQQIIDSCSISSILLNLKVPSGLRGSVYLTAGVITITTGAHTLVEMHKHNVLLQMQKDQHMADLAAQKHKLEMSQQDQIKLDSEHIHKEKLLKMQLDHEAEQRKPWWRR
jgi:hypothetical protein